MASVTLNPTIDGTLNDFTAPRTWASVHGDSTCAGSGGVNTSITNDHCPWVVGGSGSSQIIRNIFSFNLSSIPAGATITGVDFNLYVTTVMQGSGSSTYINVTKVTVATDGAIVAGDYGGFNANTTKYSTDKTLSGISTSAYLTQSFNATGISYVQTQYNNTKYAQLSSRIGWDIDNSDPGGVNYDGIDCNFRGSSTNKPQLVVTYSLPSTSGFFFLT